MSDTLEKKPDPVAEQLVDPKANPNQPTNYTPAPEVSSVAPVIAQITGGDAGNTLAGIQGAGKGSNSFFGDIGSTIAKVTSQLGAVFQAGKDVGANSPAIAAKINDLSNQKAQAVVQAGVANANIAGMDALHAAAADKQKADDAMRMHLDSNNPDQIKNMDNRTEAGKQFNEHISNLNEYRKTGFFDNPAAYLVNQIVNIPIEAGRAQRSLAVVKETTEKITADAQAVVGRSVIDDALNSKNTTERAGEVYKAALATATAAGIGPLLEGQQLQIGAYNLGISQAHLGLAQAANSREAALQPGKVALQGLQIQGAQNELTLAPGKLLQQENVAEYYKAAKDATIQNTLARTQLAQQELEDKLKKSQADTEALTQVNQFVQSIGGKGNISDPKRLAPDQLKALSTMTVNTQNFGGLADSPAHAYELLGQAKVPLNGLPAGHQATLNTISGYYNEGLVAAQSAGPNKTPLAKDARDDFVNAYVTTKIRNESNHVQASNSVLAPPSVSTLVNQPWAADNPVIQALKPLTVDGSGQTINRPVDGSMLMNTAAQLVIKGELSDTQAASALKDSILKRGADGSASGILNDIQAAGGWKRFSIPIPESWNMQYNKAGFSFGNNKDNVNFLNSADLLSKLRIQINGMRARQSLDTSGMDSLISGR